jgi:hypothetical protein
LNAVTASEGRPAGTNPAGTNGVSIASLLVSISSVIPNLLGILLLAILVAGSRYWLFWFPALIALPALIGSAIGIVGICLGIRALKRIKRTKETGRGIAVGAITVGAIPLVILVVCLGVVFVIYMSVGGRS